MTAPILVTGGTGTLGRLVVARLARAGYGVRVLTRGTHRDGGGIRYVTGDLLTGDGVESAVGGAATIVHCAGGRTGDDEATRTLVRAAARAGSPHLVYISVVGADRIPTTRRLDRAAFGYFRSKLAAERIVAASGLPWTTLRATQFHDLILTVAAALSRLPVLPVPSGLRFQPVDPGEVADRLVDLALAGPAGRVPDMGGPRAYPLADLIRGYLRATGRRRPLVPVRLPGAGAAAVRAGALLVPDPAMGRRSWEEFLAQRYARLAPA